MAIDGDLLRFGASATITAAAGGQTPSFDILAYGGGAIQPDRPQLDAPLVIDLASAKVWPRLALILDHDDSAVVGQTQQTTVDTAIRVRGPITGNIEDSSDPAGKVVYHARRGFRWGASVHGSLGRPEFVAAGRSVRVNGRDVSGPIYVARDTSITAISLLSVPADEGSVVSIAARRGVTTSGATKMTFEQWAKENRVDLIVATSVRRAMLLAAAATDGVDLDDSERGELLAAGQSAPQSREDRLRASAAAHVRNGADRELVRDLLAAAVSENWTPARLDSEIQLAGPRGEHINNEPRSASRSVSRQTLACSAILAATGDRSGAERMFGAATAEQAEQLGIRGWAGLASACLSASGSRVPHDRTELLRAASGPSTYDLSHVTADALGKQVLDAFTAAAPTYRDIAKIVPAPNFHAVKLIRLAAGGTYEKVAPGGALKHGTLSDEQLSVAPDTYGRLLAVDRRDLINDDLGLLSGGLAEELVRAGLNAVGNVVWTVFMDNATFFTSAIGNRLTTASSALSVASLSLAISALRKIKDPGGQLSGVTPFALTVPPELEATARQILTSTQLQRDVSSADNMPMGNPIPQLKLVVEPRLSDDAIAGSSTTAWYLTGAPRVGVLLAAFLNGAEVPKIETENSFESLGIRLRAYHDFGAALGDYRGGVCGDGA